VRSNRDGIGAVVRIKSASGEQWNMVRSGSSYCSQSELPLTFGLGSDATVTSIDVDWPNAPHQHFGSMPANQRIVIDEDKGILPR
jgi:hypothetical protein